jgi:hypothetical protein
MVADLVAAWAIIDENEVRKSPVNTSATQQFYDAERQQLNAFKVFLDLKPHTVLAEDMRFRFVGVAQPGAPAPPMPAVTYETERRFVLGDTTYPLSSLIRFGLS